VIRWYSSGSSERYVLEYLESFPGGAYRRTHCGNGVAAAAVAAAAAAIGRADAHCSGVTYHPTDQGRSSPDGIFARRYRRLFAAARGNRRLHGRATHTRRTIRGEEDRWWQIVGGAAVPVLRLLPG